MSGPSNSSDLPQTWVPPADDERALDLARFALGGGSLPSRQGVTLSRHLAFLPNDALSLDLSDPVQRDFGDYELLEQLGQGGMGVVYRAKQHSLDREVAVKLLAAGPWASTDFIERFRREARSAARMTHPNIVPIYEIGQFAELNFFSMRLVRGPSLASLLSKNGPLDARSTADLMRTIAEAVDYAHRLGVLHLDLKPGNVLIEESGEPQVADFGLARQLDETLSVEATEVSGTPSYMAPEQAQLRRHRLSPATDIYGLGAILYEMLTGRPPFLGGSAEETLHRVIHVQPERPCSVRAAIAADLEAICLKCLAKDPGDRYVSARALADDLSRFCDGRPVSVRRPGLSERTRRWAKREPRVAIAAGAFVWALIGGLSATAVQWQRAEKHAASAQENLWASRSQAAQAAFADGDGFRGLRRLVANLSDMEAQGRLKEAAFERQRIGTILANAPQLAGMVQIPDGGFITAVAISPNGQRIAVASLGNQQPRLVREYEIGTGALRWERSTQGQTHGLAFADSAPHGWIEYSADGAHVLAHMMQQPPFAAPMMSDTILLDSDTGAVQRPDIDFADLVLSENARFALVRWRSDASLRFPDEVQLFSVDGWQPLGKRHDADTIDHAIEWLFTPDGSGLVGTADFARLSFYEPQSLQLRWRLDFAQSDPVRAWRFSADGAVLALGMSSGAVWLVNSQDGSRSQLPNTLASIVRWLEFDASARTLLAVSDDEEILAWDLPTRRPRVLPIRSATQWQPSRVRLVDDRVFHAASSELRYWQLPALAPFDNVAVPAVARVRSQRNFWPQAFDVRAGLLASGDSDGAVRFWKLPEAPLLDARAAPLAAITLRFDGQHIVSVDGQRVYLQDAVQRVARSANFMHPEAVRFAELSSDGQYLLTIAGRTVRVLDPRNARLIGAAMLPQTPIRAELASAAPVALISTAEFRDGRFIEHLHRIDLQQGSVRTLAVDLDGPLQQLALDAQGRHAFVLERLAAGPGRHPRILSVSGESTACASIDAGERSSYGHALFAPDGNSLWLHSWNSAREHRLLQWDLQRCALRQELASKQGGDGTRLLSFAQGIVAHRFAADTLTVIESSGERRDVPALPRASVMVEFALSKDGRRAAQATRNGIALFDLVRGDRISTVLPAPIAGNDGIAKLAFAPDGQRLLARTVRGHWLLWSLPETTAEVSTLADLTTALDPDMGDQRLATAAANQWPGALAPAERPISSDDQMSIDLPALRDAGVDARFVPVDLRPATNVPLNGLWPQWPAMGGDLVTLAPGVQRFNRIDWQVDGGIQLSVGGPAIALHPTQPASADIPIAALQARAVHVLMMLHVPLRPAAPPRAAARVVLRHGDGEELALDILSKRDVVTQWQPELGLPSAQIAWSGVFSTMVRSGAATSSDTNAQIYSVSLTLPPDIGAIHSVRLEAPDGSMEAPLIYAVTLETADAH